MRAFRHCARLLLISLALQAGAAAQATRNPLQPIDPFSILPGSSFSASGGTAPSARKGYGSRAAAVAADIREAEQLIRRSYIHPASASADEMTRGAVSGMLRSLDPHSNFYDRDQWTELLDEQASGYTGIGVSLASFGRGGTMDTYVLSVFPGSSAERVGLRYGDRIVGVNGRDLSGKGSDIVRDQIRGANATSIRLTVERAASGSRETMVLRRGRVAQPSIPDAYILRGDLGYIDLSEGFTHTTAQEFDVSVRRLKAAGMRSLILDLRGNGGGILDQAVKVAERFLPKGTAILSQRGRSAVDNRDWYSTNAYPETMPLVVLVDERTASASEIVAGAFQDNDRALIVGEKTFGKGLVQSVIDLPARTGLTLTTARYLTPSGRSIQRDYSKMDLYDYFNHKGTAAGIDKPYFEARTITDRRVHGGDGIQPDEAVPGVILTREQSRVLDPIFYFVRDAINRRVVGHEYLANHSRAYGARILEQDLIVNSELLDACMARLASDPLFAELPGKDRDFIALQLRYNMALAYRGSVSAKQVLIADDKAVRRAVDVLPKAAALARRASDLRNAGR